MHLYQVSDYLTVLNDGVERVGEVEATDQGWVVRYHPSSYVAHVKHRDEALLVLGMAQAADGPVARRRAYMLRILLDYLNTHDKSLGGLTVEYDGQAYAAEDLVHFIEGALGLKDLSVKK